MSAVVRAGGRDPFSEIALGLVDALPAEQPWLVLTCETHPVAPCSSNSV
jgi:hypothetical protein